MAPQSYPQISTVMNATEERATQSPMYLNMIHSDLLPSVLSKMDYKSLTNCRRTTSRINEFVKNNRKRVKSKLRVEWIRVTEKGIIIGRWGKKQVPEEETVALQPRKIQFYRTCLERVLAINFDHFYDLEEVELMYLEEDAARAVLDKLSKTVVPISLKVSTENAFAYSNSFTAHPALCTIENIDIGNSCSSPDLSFLMSSHGTIQIFNQSISNVTTVIKTIQMICAGLLSTNVISFCLAKDVDSIAAVESALPGKPIWSYETHEQSVFNTYEKDSFSARFPSLRFYALPMAGGKIGGLCTSKYGGHLKFKVFDNEENFVERIPKGVAF